MRTLLLVVAIALAPSIASADAIPGCPPGQHVVMNPVPPGAMHHGGGSCVPDEPAPETPPPSTPPPSATTTAAPPSATQPAAPPPAESSGCSVAHARGSAAWAALAIVALALLARRRRALAPFVALAAIALAPEIARADAMPACPRGQHLEENPVSPGAMHHAGGQCVDDPGGCAIDPGARSAMPTWCTVAIAAIAIRAARRPRT